MKSKIKKDYMTAQDVIDLFNEVDDKESPVYFYCTESEFIDVNDQRKVLTRDDIDLTIEGIVDINVPMIIH